MEKSAKRPLKHQADDILHAIFEMPYMIEFSEGILSQERFLFFKVQDILYLKEYSKGLHAIGDLITKEHQGTFHKWSEGVDKELDLLQNRFKTELQNSEMSPSNLLYISYMFSCLREGNLPKILAAFYACFWVYFKVGKQLFKTALKPNPYQEWINFYHSEEFGKDVREYKKILNQSLENLPEDEIKECIKTFRKTCKMEYKFWDSAYNFEGWPLGDIRLQSQFVAALTIAGSDSSGGAGVQADLNTFHANKVVGCSAITVLTAQNSKEVSQIFPISKEMTEKQIQSVITDYDIKAIKIGMIYNAEIADGIVSSLKNLTGTRIVLDPVMVSSTGYSLISKEALETIFKDVFPLVELLTPNLIETQFLLEKIPGNDLKIITTAKEMEIAGRKLCEFFKVKAVLVKGGHAKIDGKAIDVLVRNNQEQPEIFEREYLDSKNTHGTGCSLSSAIAANLAKGFSLSSAVKVAKGYVFNAIRKGYKLGKGEFGTLNHFA